ncbi:MAG TPA: acyl-CoA dehydrogenase family protein [Candidatus Dormibacteraeota bacterium]|nr:acyl-CoA dehydrogenase family protein [Candidatus Dormibacteraeota bacterium]
MTDPALDDLRRLARDFAQKEVAPLAARTDREHRFPAEPIARAAALGLLGITVPQEYGGGGLGHTAFATLIEEVAAVCASTSVIIDVHTSVGMEPILNFGSEAQKQRWLPKLASGEVLGAFALTEPGAGSDAGNLRTSARKADDGYVLNGSKVFITNLGHAGTYIVMARTGGPGASGVSAFVVEADSKGLTCGPPFDKMGLHGSPTGELTLSDVFVPDDHLLGGEGRGFAVAMTALDAGRIGISAQAVGLARGALEDATSYVRERQQFGRPIADFQGVQFMLADMATQLEAARILTYRAAQLCDDGQPFAREASMAKLFATDTAMQVTIDAVQLLGGYGYIEEFSMARRMRDAKACQIYEGTNQVQRVVIARQLLR